MASIKGTELEFYPKSLQNGKDYPENTGEIYYRPFLYGAESGFRRWKKGFLLGRILFKNKWLRRFFGMI